ncbi:MAG: SDR family NAD(P)-dependent oxidoreductase [Allomuricauda sp.]
MVTCASCGIGRQITLILAESQVDLVLCSRNENKLHRLAAKLSGSHKIEVIILAFDLSVKRQVLDLLAAKEEMDSYTLIHAVGYGALSHFTQNHIHDDVKMINLNIRSTAWLTYKFGNRFSRYRKAHIVLTSSLLTFQKLIISPHLKVHKRFWLKSKNSSKSINIFTQ